MIIGAYLIIYGLSCLVFGLFIGMAIVLPATKKLNKQLVAEVF